MDAPCGGGEIGDGDHHEDEEEEERPHVKRLRNLWQPLHAEVEDD